MVSVTRRELRRADAVSVCAEFPRGTVLGSTLSLLDNASVNIGAGGAGVQS